MLKLPYYPYRRLKLMFTAYFTLIILVQFLCTYCIKMCTRCKITSLSITSPF
ncbi:hypothetical protein Hanom_Chr04g00373311 [Helianthus anomalus]